MIGEFKTKSPQHADLLVATHPDVCNGKAMGNTLPVTPHTTDVHKGRGWRTSHCHAKSLDFLEESHTKQRLTETIHIFIARGIVLTCRRVHLSTD